jgi:hypothetical protein
MTTEFHCIRFSGTAYSVLVDGRSVGVVKHDRATFGGWIAYQRGQREVAVLGDDGCARVFETRDEAAAVLQG